MKKYLVALGFVAASCSPVAAQVPQCVGIVDFIHNMHVQNMEQIGRGDLSNGREVQVWSNESGEFIIVAINANVVCVAATGTHYTNSNRAGDL